jgi:hypothetical protein
VDEAPATRGDALHFRDDNCARAVRLAPAREPGLGTTEREEDSVDDDRREGGEPLEREAEQSTEEHLEEDVAQDIDLDEDEEGDEAGPSFDPARYLPPD